jgi:hypothetical protein
VRSFWKQWRPASQHRRCLEHPSPKSNFKMATITRAMSTGLGAATWVLALTLEMAALKVVVARLMATATVPRGRVMLCSQHRVEANAHSRYRTEP